MSRLDSRLKTLERRVGDGGREVVFLWCATDEEKRAAEQGGVLVVNFKWADDVKIQNRDLLLDQRRSLNSKP